MTDRNVSAFEGWVKQNKAAIAMFLMTIGMIQLGVIWHVMRLLRLAEPEAVFVILIMALMTVSFGILGVGYLLRKHRRLFFMFVTGLSLFTLGMIPVILVGWHPAMPQAYVLLFGAIIVAKLHPYSGRLIALVADGTIYLGGTAVVSSFLYFCIRASINDPMALGAIFVGVGIGIAFFKGLLTSLEIPHPHWLMSPSLTLVGISMLYHTLSVDISDTRAIMDLTITLVTLHGFERIMYTSKLVPWMEQLMLDSQRWYESRQSARRLSA